MPKNTSIFKVNVGPAPLEKSLSKPEISEINNDLDRNSTAYSLDEQESNKAVQANNSQKGRKISWFRRLLKPFRRRRRTTEPPANPYVPIPIQKSSSCKFYTPPPSEFLVKATTTNDDSQPKNEKEATNDMDEYKNDPVTRTSSILMARPLHSAFISEFKNSLKNNDEVDVAKKKDETPKYGNVADFKNMASPRRRQRSQSMNSILDESLSDLDNLYEPTWKVFPTDQESNTGLNFPFSEPDGLRDPNANRCSNLEPQPIEPLHKFPKPKPPIKRRPSARRGSQPEVPNKKGSLDFDNKGPLANRRSNAELEEIILKLSDIPAPDARDTDTNMSKIPPSPKRRTKFFATLPRDDNNCKVEVQTPSDKKITNVSSLPAAISIDTNEGLRKKYASLVKEIELETEMNKKTSINKKIPQKRSSSCSTVAMLLNDADETTVSPEEVISKKEGSTVPCNNVAISELYRCNSLPSRNYRNSEGLNRYCEESLKDIKLQSNANFKNNLNQTAVLLNSKPLPLTKDTATQTSSLLLTQIFLKEAASSSEFQLEPLCNESKEIQIDSKETEEVNQNTPPNTPEYPENEEPANFENAYNNEEVINTTTYQVKEHIFNDHTDTRGVVTQHHDRNKISKETKEAQIKKHDISDFRSNLKIVSNKQIHIRSDTEGLILENTASNYRSALKHFNENERNLNLEITECEEIEQPIPMNVHDFRSNLRHINDEQEELHDEEDCKESQQQMPMSVHDFRSNLRHIKDDQEELHDEEECKESQQMLMSVHDFRSNLRDIKNDQEELHDEGDRKYIHNKKPKEVPSNLKKLISNREGILSFEKKTWKIETQEEEEVISAPSKVSNKTIPDKVTANFNFEGKKIPPIKPERIRRKPPQSLKPTILPKPQEFVRQGALRLKRNSEDQPTSPTRQEPLISPLNKLNSSENLPESRKHSLLPPEELNENQDSLKKNRRSRSIV